ncbi:hypothetical protein HPP92_015691 [Vanilla planifolia]|uniref:Uncharacterized protein n=1 Tax=Vanilla planifolia TaxID=51239 RepID=A0A835QPZ0_VANPL|nr:hypothetical protein HPP92_015691 [Vanilla planifolia]
MAESAKGLDGLGGVYGNHGADDDLKEFDDAIADNSLFDSSQYAFFGKDVVEEVELGGLEDDDYGDASALNGDIGMDNENFNFDLFGGRKEVDFLVSSPEIDDLTTTFTKLNRTVSEPRNVGVIGDTGSFSRESSSTVDWTPEPEFSNWLDQQILDAGSVQDGNHRWWSQPQSSSACHSQPKSLYRASSYPEQPVLQQHMRDPVLLPNSSFTSYPPLGDRLESSVHEPNFPSLYAASQLPLCAHNMSPFALSHLHLPGHINDPTYGGNMAQFAPNRLINSRPKNQWMNQTIHFGRDNPIPAPGLLQQQISHSKGLMTSQLFHFSRSKGHILSHLCPIWCSCNLRVSTPNFSLIFQTILMQLWILST